MPTTRQVRRASYSLARALGDWNAIASGDPKRIAKRFANKWIGRHTIERSPTFYCRFGQTSR